MGTSKNLIVRLKKKYNKRLDKMIAKDASFTDILSAIKNSTHNEFGGVTRREIKNFESDFIVTIEKCLPSLEKIVKNPRQFIREEYNVVPIERARKTGSKAIQHLVMHSEFVKEIDREGNVIPDKILGTFIEEEIAIYENRFIMTLIRKLALFVEMRYQYIAAHADTNNSDLYTIKSIVHFGEKRYEYEGRLKLVEPSDDEGHRTSNADLLKRLTVLHQRVNFLVNSAFMKNMKRATIVTGKIQLTNIIRRNLDYYKGYELWVFINQYLALGVSYSIKEKKITFDEAALNQLYKLVFSSYFSMNSEKMQPADKKVKNFKVIPHFVTPILDKDIASDRFLEKALNKNVSLRTMTDAQIAAKEKRQREKEKERLRKIEEQELLKAKILAKKQKEKETELKRILKEKEKARLLKLAAEAKKLAKEKEARRLEREKLARKKQQAEVARQLAEEAAKLKAARTYVKVAATTQKAKPMRMLKNQNKKTPS